MALFCYKPREYSLPKQQQARAKDQVPMGLRHVQVLIKLLQSPPKSWHTVRVSITFFLPCIPSKSLRQLRLRLRCPVMGSDSRQRLSPHNTRIRVILLFQISLKLSSLGRWSVHSFKSSTQEAAAGGSL